MAAERGEGIGQLHPPLVPLRLPPGPRGPVLLLLPPGSHRAFPGCVQSLTEFILGARLGARRWLCCGKRAQVPLLQEPPLGHGRPETLWHFPFNLLLLLEAQQTAVGKGGCGPHRGSWWHLQKGLQPPAAASSGLGAPGSRGGMAVGPGVTGRPGVFPEVEALVENISSR